MSTHLRYDGYRNSDTRALSSARMGLTANGACGSPRRLHLPVRPGRCRTERGDQLTMNVSVCALPAASVTMSVLVPVAAPKVPALIAPRSKDWPESGVTAPLMLTEASCRSSASVKVTLL